MDDNLHGYGGKLKRSLERLARCGAPAADQRLIRSFHDDCFSDGLGVPRVEKYVRHLITLSSWLSVTFERASVADVKTLLRRIQGSHYADWTKHDLRLVLKRFYRWLRENGYTQQDLDWIKLGSAVAKSRLPEDMPTPEDVKAMVAATKSARNKAFIMLIYETGARIGEIARLRVRNIVPHPHGLEIHLPIEGKSGARRVLVVGSTPYLKAWLNQHPHAQRPEASLWPWHPSGKALKYGTFSAILKRAAQAAGIAKKVNPHNFRHARATYLAKHLTEAQMNQFFGWVQGSDMPSTYVHLSGRDVDEALLRSYGIEAKQKPETDKLAPRKCNQCQSQNPATHAFCGVCGLPLDETAAQEVVKRDLDRSRADQVMDRLIQDEEFRALLERKLRNLSTSGP